MTPAQPSFAPSVEFLEQKLVANPTSPLLVRLASLYLGRDKGEVALNLCEAGIAQYRDYATAHLLRAKCLIRIGRFEEAKQELQRTLKLQPRCRVVQDLLQEIEEREREKMHSEASGMRHGEGTRPSISVEEEIRGMETFTPEQGGVEIATPTLAEIYASQGAFREAIRTYLLLSMRKPEEKERFEVRIKELKERWRSVGPPS
jgi:tetratricopeptide (TPR) repeat protein